MYPKHGFGRFSVHAVHTFLIILPSCNILVKLRNLLTCWDKALRSPSTGITRSTYSMASKFCGPTIVGLHNGPSCSLPTIFLTANGNANFLAATKQLYEWFSPSVCLSHLFTPQPKLGSRGIVVIRRAGGRGHFTVTALTGAALIRSRSNLVGTNLGAGPRTSSFLGDVAR